MIRRQKRSPRHHGDLFKTTPAINLCRDFVPRYIERQLVYYINDLLESQSIHVVGAGLVGAAHYESLRPEYMPIDIDTRVPEHQPPVLEVVLP